MGFWGFGVLEGTSLGSRVPSSSSTSHSSLPFLLMRMNMRHLVKLLWVIQVIHSLLFYCEGFTLKSGRWKLLPLPGAINKTKLPLHAYNGLLSGLSNISSQKYYSSSIPSNHALEVVSNKRLLFDIVEDIVNPTLTELKFI